jgi:hypothetical protein
VVQETNPRGLIPQDPTVCQIHPPPTPAFLPPKGCTNQCPKRANQLIDDPLVS